MKILSIETSCDETALSVIESDGHTIYVRGNALASQVALHAQYGGVFPMMAKRAHAEKIIPLLSEALEQAGLLVQGTTPITDEQRSRILTLCAREGNIAQDIFSFVESHDAPRIDHIAVTAGPGLEPALWVGINTARILGELWGTAVYPINHMEGHIISAVFEQKSDKEFALRELAYPTLSLLVSGGHTELVLSRRPLSYEKIGQTRDDAVGEAFDKVARILGLPYPGGPKISALALEARTSDMKPSFSLPRPMLHSGDYDFSFSGLKTAVLYLVRDLQKEHSDILENVGMLRQIAREFEEAAVEVLVTKTLRAVEEYSAQTILVGGGVAANAYLREQLGGVTSKYGVGIHFPSSNLSTDNSVMIGMASCYHAMHRDTKAAPQAIRADGNLSI